MSTEGKVRGPFYFKSYESVVGVAQNPTELRREVARLADENPRALEYHLREGHIVSWLGSLDEREMAEQLKGVHTAKDAKAWAQAPQGRRDSMAGISVSGGQSQRAPRKPRARRKR